MFHNVKFSNFLFLKELVDSVTKNITLVGSSSNFLFSNYNHFQLSASCGPEGFTDVEKNRVEVAISSGSDPSFVSNCELPAKQVHNTLQVLDLSDNNLEMVPETVCMLTALGELNLSKYVQVLYQLNLFT